MKIILRLVLVFLTLQFYGQNHKVSVEKNAEGYTLIVQGKPFMINGMNWDYVPIGTNVLHGFWEKPTDYIKAALDSEMSLLKNMGVNTIRVYTGIKPKWVRYIYENYGIYTVLNHTFGAYGLTIDGVWYPNTEYSSSKVKEKLLEETTVMVNRFKNTPGLLLFMLGNENNYHLSWGGAETENLPIQKEGSVISRRARAMYELFNEAAKKIKSIDPKHPVAMCNGDLLYLDLVKEMCSDVDIYATNMYRGISFTDAFQKVKTVIDKPILFAEFGADAFNAITNKEDQYSQAFYTVGNWKEIYKNAAGLGNSENSIGGFTFHFSDGWWKYGFNDRKNADIHDTNASWSNGGYQRDFTQGANNMNEEWFGICAKGKTDERGLYALYPRAAYYALKEVHNLNPYEEGVTSDFVENYFANIQLTDAALRARGDKAALNAESGNKLKISELRSELTTFNTGGSLITTPSEANPNDFDTYPNRLGVDHMQSFFVGVEGKAAENMKANVVFNVLGNVATNPIDEIFYENRGRTAVTNDGELTLNSLNRVQLYKASYDWNAKWFHLKGFYRTGHFHWGYEGDLFGLYREANYGPNLDIYNGEFSGFEIAGKKSLKGLKVAFGPQLWWGANPAVLVKYRTKLGGFKVTGIYHEDIDNTNAAVTSIAIPLPKTRRATIAVEKKLGSFGIQAGAIWGGQPLNDRTFQVARGTSGNYTVYEDKIRPEDNWGGKAKITFQKGAFNWYAQGAVMGLVANGGADETKTFTGWRLKDSGSGNQTNFLSGFTYTLGNFQIAPNFLWQKPIVAAMPNDLPTNSPGRLRNIIDDPFAVRANRETTAGELLLTYDPTPGTWMYEWDNDRAEDAKFAANLGFVYRHLPTAQDAAIGFLRNRTLFAFPNSAPAKDLWEVNSRMVSKWNSNLGFIANVYFGNAQANGSDTRTIERFGGDIRVIYNKFKFVHSWKVNDWGPFDYHRDFNLTFPVQSMFDVSTTVGKPDWFILPNTRIGARFTWRSLDQYSPRYAPTKVPDNTFPPVPVISPVGFDDGNEWEIRTYIHINIGK